MRYPKPPVFLFVNPTSGGNKAKGFVDIPLDASNRVTVDGQSVYIYDIRDGAPGDKPSFKALKAETEKLDAGEFIAVVACGGDGTVLWVASELEATQIEESRIAVAVIPFGTGNDFAGVTMWGNHPPPRVGQELLPVLLKLYREASVQEYDIWEVAIEARDLMFCHGREKVSVKDKTLGASLQGQHHVDVDKEQKDAPEKTDAAQIAEQPKKRGSILMTELPEGKAKLGHKKSTIMKVQHTTHGLVHMRKPMLNYMSFGYSARCTLGLEKNRTKSRMGNQIRFAIEGFKKTFCTKPPKLQAYLEQIEDENGIIASSDGTNKFRGAMPEMELLNIPSFAGGADFWKDARKVGIDVPEKSAAELLETEQSFQDGRIEINGYNSVMGFSMDVGMKKGFNPCFLCGGCCCKGFGKRIASTGQMTWTFRQPGTYEIPKDRVHVQIDGEPFVIVEPRTMIFSPYRKLRVLVNTGPKLATLSSSKIKELKLLAQKTSKK